MSLNLPLIALAAGAFGIGTAKFAPMGLLPVIAADLHVSIPTAGLLVTGYALGGLVGAPLLTLSTERCANGSHSGLWCYSRWATCSPPCHPTMPCY